MNKNLLNLLPEGRRMAEVLAEIRSPTWRPRSAHCTNWEDFVPLEMRRAWKSLSVDSRIIAFVMSSELADGSRDYLERETIQ